MVQSVMNDDFERLNGLLSMIPLDDVNLITVSFSNARVVFKRTELLKKITDVWTAIENNPLFLCCELEAVCAPTVTGAILRAKSLSQERRLEYLCLLTSCKAFEELAFKFINEPLSIRQDSSCLREAVITGQEKIVAFLLNIPEVDVNVSTVRGITPLQAAAHRGHFGMVKLLMSCPRVDVNKPNNAQGTPLLIACQNGYSDVVSVLLSHPSIDVNHRDLQGQSPLAAAAKGIFEKAFDVDRGPRFKVSPPDSHLECIKLLVKRPELDVNAINREGGISALGVATKALRFDLVQALLTREDINADDAIEACGSLLLKYQSEQIAQGFDVATACKIVRLAAEHPRHDTNSVCKYESCIKALINEHLSAQQQENESPSKDPTDMSVKELKTAIQQAGLADRALGLAEKTELVALLQQHLLSETKSVSQAGTCNIV